MLPFFNNDDRDIVIACYAIVISVLVTTYKLINKIINMLCKEWLEKLTLNYSYLTRIDSDYLPSKLVVFALLQFELDFQFASRRSVL